MKIADGRENFEPKLRRTYSIGIEAQKRNLIGPSADSLHSYVDNLIKLPDSYLDTLTKLIMSVDTVERN